jgi:hypothetical protein
MRHMNDTPTHAELLALWKRDSDLAAAMQVPYTRARQWRARGLLPSEYWPAFIIQLAELFDRHVTYEQLTLAYREARQSRRQEMAEAPPGADAA